MKTIQRLPVRQPLVTDWPRIEVPCVMPAHVSAHGIIEAGQLFSVALYDGISTVKFDADGLTQIELSLACKEALAMLQDASVAVTVGSA